MSARRRCCGSTAWSSTFPVRRGVVRPRRAARCARSTASSFELRAGRNARRWSANRAAASRRTGRLVLRLLEPTRGPGRLRRRGSRARSTRDALRAARRAMQIIFQDPYASLNPRMTVGQTLAEPLDAARACRRAPRASASPSCCSMVGLAPAHARALSARVLRRAAPAHRHRARARGRAAAHRLRRAGVRARRLDPGAGHQPAARPAAAASACRTSSSRTISRWSSTSRRASP